MAHAGVAHFAVLVSPVGVVHVVSHEIIYLLSGRVLGASLSRSCKRKQRQLVDVVKLLSDTSIQSEVAVIDSLDPVVSSKTR